MTRPFVLALALLSSSHAQNLFQVSRFAEEQRNLVSSVIRRNHSHLASLSLANEFFSFNDLLHIFDADREDEFSPNCAEDLRALISAKDGISKYPELLEQVWLPMRDSTGRFNEAILKGHVYFAGHYSECVQVDAQLTGRDRRFKADYFRIDVDIRFQPNWKNGSCALSKSGALIGWSFGVCLPASCSSIELEDFFTADTAKHNPVCRVQRTNDSVEGPGAGFYTTVSIMGVICALCVLSGFADFFFSDYLRDKVISKGLLWQLFMSFSLYSNVAGIFETSHSKKDGQITPIHCMRFFSMCWVVLGHLTGAMLSVVANPLDIIALTKDLTTEFILNAFFSVDSFFFIGGLLLSFLWFKNYEKDPKLTNSPAAWAMFYVHRILRLSPPFFMMVIFYTFVLNQLYRDSPFNMNTLRRADYCKENWWLEFTYLHNIIEGDKQCLGYSWYLATDTQIFFFAPLLIIPLALKPMIGFLVAAVAFTVSSAVNIFLVYHYHWPANLQFVGAKDPEITNVDDYMTYMYMSPITRCQVVNVFVWVLSFAMMLYLILGLHAQSTGILIPIFWRAMYSAFSKPAWALVLSWIIISCYYGYGGPINSFMSWHIWVPLGRLSFCGYLVHYPMIYTVLTQAHDEIYFSSFIDFVITRLIPIIALTFFISIFWSACFEISFGKMEMILLGGRRMKVRPIATTVSERKMTKFDVEKL